MKTQISLPYRTQKLQMSSVIFESMVNNLGQRIRRMNFQLHFKTKTEMAAFITAKQRADERDESQLDLEGSDDEAEKPNNEEKPVVAHREAESCMDSIVIQQTFEKSILLRECFLDRLKGIEERLKVKFMVVPKKVKISGCSRARVDDAQDQYRQLQEDICFEPIDRFGKEVFLSRYFRGLLNGGKVNIVEILKKYYFWFLKSETEPRQVIMQAFMETRHALYPLHRLRSRQKEAIAGGRGAVVLGQVQFSRGGQRITDQLYTCVRARLFESSISKRLSQMEERQDRQVELSEDRKSLILHMDADEQIQIQKESIEQEFKRFQYLFLRFPEEICMKAVSQTLQQLSAPSVAFKKEKKANNNGEQIFIWQIMGHFLCLTFMPPSKEIPIQQRLSIHPLSRIIAVLPQQLLRFSLGLMDSIQLPQSKEWAYMTVEHDYQQKLNIVGFKSHIKSNYDKLAILYLEDQLNSQFLGKTKVKKEAINTSISQGDVSIDLSRQINQSTQFLKNDLSMDRQKEKEEPAPSPSSSKINQILTSQQLANINFRFEAYTFLLEQPIKERQKKYADDVAKPEIGKIPYGNQLYKQKIKEATTFQYKFFRVKLPISKIDLNKQAQRILKERPDLAHLHRWITVFSGGKQCKELQGLCEQGKRVRMIKIQKNYKIKEGFLMTTSPLFIFVEDRDDLPSNMYEPICFIRKIE